ncbi:thiamine pyrophosphate-binding protein [Lactobacillus johnsonii]|uniref:thiamine pyrophosphate-binding protein n=1 Tax=Lactobacillus johnsonii TaxID=33959 RepID=UPI000317A65E
MAEEKYYGANAIVDSLINHDVKFVFGIPGAKIDRVFELLEHSKDPRTPKFVLTRHEQNAAFMAAGVRKDYRKTRCCSYYLRSGCIKFSNWLSNCYSRR